MRKRAEKENNPKKKNSTITSKNFVIVLALISILGFVGIISETIFYYDLKGIIESLWILILGTGLLIETKYQKLKSMRRGLTNENFPHMTNFVIGAVAVLAGILSFPIFKIDNPSFSAIRGILSLIAIIIIIIETWLIKRRKKFDVQPEHIKKR